MNDHTDTEIVLWVYEQTLSDERMATDVQKW